MNLMNDIKGKLFQRYMRIILKFHFLKSNDKTFCVGNAGQVAFPNLVVKNLKYMLNDLVIEIEE